MPERPTPPAKRAARGQRAREIVVAARAILEEHGHEELTMRRLGEAVGMRAPSLYKHFPDKAAVEVALIEEGFAEIAAAFERGCAEHGESLASLAGAYRDFAREHPALYRLMTSGPLPRDRLRPGVEARAAAPLLRVIANPDVARAAWAWAHGMTIMELDGRFPPEADLDAAWVCGIAAFNPRRSAKLPIAVGDDENASDSTEWNGDWRRAAQAGPWFRRTKADRQRREPLDRATQTRRSNRRARRVDGRAQP